MFALGPLLKTVPTPAAVDSGVAAATWTIATGTSKYSGITLSGANLTMTPDGAGSFEGVRASRSATGSFSFTATLSSISTPANVATGIDDGTTDLSIAGVLPGDSNSNGVVLQIFTGQWYISRNGGVAQGPFASPSPALSQVVTVTCNKTAGTISFMVGATAIGVAETGVAFTNWYAIGFGKGSDGIITANFAGY